LQASLPLAALGALGGLAQLAQAASGTASARRLPVLFIGHGSPMNALEDNPFSRFLQGWANRFARPQAILVVSAHWLTPGLTAVGVQAQPKTIHDFGGFPQGAVRHAIPRAGCARAGT
jgi:4,5-DOPA dioxygenase extradiol